MFLVVLWIICIKKLNPCGCVTSQSLCRAFSRGREIWITQHRRLLTTEQLSFCVSSKLSPSAGDVGWKNPLKSRGTRHTGCPGFPYSGISRPSRDWGHVCPKHRCHRPCHSCPTTSCWEVTSWSVPNLCKSSPSHRMSSQDAMICLLLTCIKLSICGDSKTKFPSEDVTRPVGLTSFSCPFAYPSGALSDTGHHLRRPLCQKCSDGWPPPITFPFMSETLTLPLLPLLALPSSFLLISPLPLALSSELSALTPKEKMTESLPVFPLRKTVFWMALPQGMCYQLASNSCTLWGSSRPMDMKWTQCSAFHGVKPARDFWTVEKDKDLLLYWGTEFAGKVFAEVFWCHQYCDDTFLFQREKYFFHW